MSELPEGLVHREGFVGADEEGQLLRALEELDFRAVEMRGQTARRTVRHSAPRQSSFSPGRRTC